MVSVQASAPRVNIRVAARPERADWGDIPVANETGVPSDRLQFPREGEKDTVTGLPPRKALNEDLPRLLKMTATERLPLCAIMIDIDHFKKFNDRWGHSIGDRVLGHVSSLIRNCARYRGEAYRYGGEEITVLLINFNTGEGLAAAERMVETVRSTPMSIPGNDPAIPVAARSRDGEPVRLEVRISAGVCSTRDVTGAELLVMADKALYEAKESGRDRAVGFTPGLNAEKRTSTISVRFQGKSPILDRNRLIIKAWFPIRLSGSSAAIADMEQIEAREIRFLESNVSEVIPEASPAGGLITLEIPGRVVSVENQGKYTFFEFDVREEVFEMIQTHRANWKSGGPY